MGVMQPGSLNIVEHILDLYSQKIVCILRARRMKYRQGMTLLRLILKDYKQIL